MDDFVISPSPYFGHVSRYPRWTNAEMKTRTLGHTLLKIHRFNSQWTKYTIVCAESMSSIWNIFVSSPKWRVEHLRQTTHSSFSRDVGKEHIFFSVFASKTNDQIWTFLRTPQQWATGQHHCREPAVAIHQSLICKSGWLCMCLCTSLCIYYMSMYCFVVFEFTNSNVQS